MGAYPKFRFGAIAFAGIFVGLWGLGSVAVAVGPTKISTCRTIAQSGSYVVEKNLTATGDCLVIRADFVTLDLGGFALTGNGSGNGVTDNGVSHKGILIRNGTITNFGNGISLSGGGTVSNGIDGVRAISNAFFGIFVNQGGVTGSIATANGAAGIYTTNGIITGNLVSSNGHRSPIYAAIVAFGGVVTGNQVSFNSRDGISVNAGAVATGNTSVGNGGNGIDVVCPSNLIGNTAIVNTGANLVSSGANCNFSNNVAP